jgi:hypothetical protein
MIGMVVFYAGGGITILLSIFGIISVNRDIQRMMREERKNGRRNGKKSKKCGWLCG